MKSGVHPLSAYIAKARRPHGGGQPVYNPFADYEEFEKTKKENAKLKEKVRKLQDEIFELVVLADHVPGGKKKKKDEPS